jgi:uncharacterized membrane protein
VDASVVVASVVRWIHILSAITAVGGMIFLRLILHPAAKAELTEEQHAALRERIMKRWPRVVHVCIGLLILTGLYNFAVVALPIHRGQALYHGLFGVKLLLAMAVFFLAIGLTGKSAALAGLRKKGPAWMALNVLMASAVVLLSAVLKNIPPSP